MTYATHMFNAQSKDLLVNDAHSPCASLSDAIDAFPKLARVTGALCDRFMTDAADGALDLLGQLDLCAAPSALLNSSPWALLSWFTTSTLRKNWRVQEGNEHSILDIYA